MMWFLILLASSFSASEKLDRTYLPPPGAQFAGGNPEEIQAPLENPNHSQVGPILQNSVPIRFKEVDTKKQPIKLPVTTTSYAFSQTTTFPPAENYELPAVPNLHLNSVTAVPVQNVGQLNPLQYHPEPTLNIPNLSEMLKKHIISPDEPINIGGSTFNPPASKLDFVNYPIGPNINQKSNPLLSPNFQTVESVSQIPDVIQYSNRQNDQTQPETLKNSDQSNVSPNQQFDKAGNQGLPTVTVKQNNLDYPKKYDNQNNFKGSADFSKKSDLSSALENSLRNPVYYFERPQAAGDRNAVILRYDNVRTPNGYSYSFETSNGIRADERGVVDDGTKAHGSYSYIGDDGKVYSVYYTADENGFQPHGDHLPTPPPVPEAIKKVIEQAAIDEAGGIVDDGSYDENKYGYREHFNPEYQRNIPRHKVQHSQIRPIAALTADHNRSSYPSRNDYVSTGIGYKSEGPEVREDDRTYLQHDGNPGVFSNLLPATEANNGKINVYGSNNRNPIDTNSKNSQYPESIDINRKVDNFVNYQSNHEPTYDYINNLNKVPNSGQLPLTNDGFSEISEGRHNEELIPTNKIFTDLSKKYSSGNEQRVHEMFNAGNVDDFDSIKIKKPLVTDLDQDINNQQTSNQDTFPQINEDGYYYSLPQNTFKQTTYPTRNRVENIPSIMKLAYNNTALRPFSSPENHDQLSILKQYSKRPLTRPQIIVNALVDSPIGDSNNDNVYGVHKNTGNNGPVTTISPGGKADDGPFHLSQTVMPSYIQTTSTPTSSILPEYVMPLNYTRFQQTQKPIISGEPPGRVNFDTTPGYYKTFTEQKPVDYSVGTKIPIGLDKLNRFILPESGIFLPESAPIATHSQELNIPNYGSTISSSTLSEPISPLNSVPQNTQTLPSGYQYKPPNPFFSTTELPSTIGTTSNFFVPSTEPSIIPQVYSTTTQYNLPYSSTPNNSQQNLVVNENVHPIASELLSIIPSQSQGNIPNRKGNYVSDENVLHNPEIVTLASVRPLDENTVKLNPTYSINQSQQYPINTNVIGEDFSGPKQTQRFDTQTGYHYK